MDAAQKEVAERLAQHEGIAISDVLALIERQARELAKADLVSVQFASGDELMRSPGSETRDTDRPPPLAPHELSLPLCYGKRQLATLRVLRAALAEPFSEHELETLRMFAERTASGLLVASLQAVEAREHARLSLLDRVGRELNHAHDRQGVEAAILRILRGALEHFADATAFYVPSVEGFVPLEGAHRDPALAEGLAPMLLDELFNKGVSSWLQSSLQDGATQLFDFSAEDASAPSTSSALARALAADSLLLAPLTVRQHTLGIVCFGRGAGRAPFSRFELSWVDELALRCGLALDNARLFEELRAALEWRETLLATISHDLKSPLSAIRLSATSLVPDAPQVERRSGRRQVELIRRSADYMNNMVNDLLLESLLTAGNFTLERRSEELAELVAEACQLSEPLAQARGLTLERDLSPELGRLDVDGERVLRVFANLISNAAKFSPRGGTIRVRGELQDGLAVFSVRDAGPGIAADVQQRLFTRYARGKNSPHGLGLGLYICKSIVEAHGGKIWVKSAPGAGATFFFTLQGAVS